MTRVRTVLVVSSDGGAVSTLTDLLMAWGSQVDRVANTTEALHRLDAESYDVVVVDTSVDGGDVVRFDAEIRARSATLHSRLIYLAEAVEGRHEVKRFLRETPRPIVAKPIGRLDLETSLFVAAGPARGGPPPKA